MRVHETTNPSKLITDSTSSLDGRALSGPRPSRKRVAPKQLCGGLRIVAESGTRTTYDSIQVSSPRDVVALMTPIAEMELTEVFWMIALNAQHRVINGAPFVITRGILNSSLVHPRETYRPALVVGAAAIIVCHNHPSGDPAPSADDRAVTEQLAAAGRVLDVPLHDHIILGKGRYTSFAEAGLL
jgi:DNA repair protein RadC